MIGFRILEYTFTFVEAIVGILILEEASGKKRSPIRKMVAASVLITIIVWTLNQFQLFSAFTTAVSVASFVLYGIMFRKIGWIKSLMLASGYLLLIYISDFLVVSFVGMLWQEEMLAAIVGEKYSIERVILLFLSKLLLVLAYIFLKRYYLREARFEGWKVLPAAAAVFLVLYFCVQNSLSGLSAEGVIM